MKILFVIETLSRGGAERVLVNTLPGLQKLGIECEVATLFSGSELVEELEKQGIKVHRLQLSYKWNVFEGVLKLHRLVKSNHYDIIHAHLFFAYFYTGLIKLFNIKVKTVTTFHNLGFDEYPANTILKKIRKFVDRKIIEHLFDKTTAVSNAVKNHYETHFQLSSIDVIFNSFPIDSFQKYQENKKNTLLKKHIQLNNNLFTILTAGRFVEKKGHKYLINAIKLLNKTHQNFVFLFVGKGPLDKILKKEELSNLKFIAEMPHSQLMQLYKEVDIIVTPSIFEAFGLVVGEAMIMEKGIVATEVDGIVEMITNEKEGLLVPPKDSEALAQAIERLYNDKPLQKYLAKSAKKKIKQFDTKIIAEQWVTYYQGMLN